MSSTHSNPLQAQVSTQIAKSLRTLYFGGNWTGVNVSEQLMDISYEEAQQRIGNFNTIAILLNHTTYYVRAVIRVLKGEPINAKDELSFDHLPINNNEDWQNMISETMSLVEELTMMVEKLPDDILEKDFVDAKYGSYYRNLQGISEHTHYHLGQIVILKKLIRKNNVQKV